MKIYISQTNSDLHALDLIIKFRQTNYSKQARKNHQLQDLQANELVIEQSCGQASSLQEDIPESFRFHLNFVPLDQLKRNSSISSVSSLTYSNNQSLNQMNKNIMLNRPLQRLLKVIRTKLNKFKNRKNRINSIQNVYEEKIINSDIQSSKVNSKYLFDPSNPIFLIFQQVKLVFLLFLLIFITFIWSFDYIDDFLQDQRLTLYVPIILSIDILAKFNIAIIVKGKVIKNRLSIMKHYITGQFFEDAFFLFSFILLIYTKRIVMATLFYVSGTQILYKIINKLQDLFDLSLFSSEVMKLIKLILFINLIAHFIACVWHYVGYNTTHLGNTWIDVKGIRNDTTFIRYTYSFYWSVVTMVTVGYGDIIPINYLEMIVSVIVMFLSCGVFAFSLNLIGQIVSTVNQDKIRLEKNIRTLNNYFKQHNINDELQNRVKNYLEYSIKEEEKENIKTLLSKLPNHLQHEVIQKAYFNILCQTPLIANSFSQTVLNNSSHLLQMAVYQPEDIIVNQFFQDDNETALYFIDQGLVQVIEQQSKTILLELSHGQTFCLKEFFTGKQARYSFVCKTKTSILKLPRKLFLNILMKDDFEKFHEIKHRFEFNIPIEDLKCQLCQSPEHFTDNCQVFFYIPQISQLLIREQNLKQNRRKQKRGEIKQNTFANQQKILEKQFQFIENYGQENSVKDIENPANMTQSFSSNLNVIFRHPDHQATSDPDNPIQKQQKSKQFLAPNDQTKQLSPSKEKSQFMIKHHSESKIKEANLEFDRMIKFHKYFNEENYENQIRKYNSCVYKQFKQMIPLLKRKSTRAMRFIFDF